MRALASRNDVIPLPSEVGEKGILHFSPPRWPFFTTVLLMRHVLIFNRCNFYAADDKSVARQRTRIKYIMPIFVKYSLF